MEKKKKHACKFMSQRITNSFHSWQRDAGWFVVKPSLPAMQFITWVKNTKEVIIRKNKNCQNISMCVTGNRVDCPINYPFHY